MSALLLRRRWLRNRCRIKRPREASVSRIGIFSCHGNVVTCRQGNVGGSKGLFHCFCTLLEPLSPPTLRHLPADLIEANEAVGHEGLGRSLELGHYNNQCV